MEGNSINSFENLCKIFEMRIKLDKEKGVKTSLDVLSNYEKYSKKIDSVYNSAFQKELKPLISPAVTLEKEEDRLRRLIKLLEDRLDRRIELEDRFYNSTGKYINGLQIIVSEEELEEKKERLSLISNYLDTSREIDNVSDSINKLKDSLAIETEKKAEYESKNKIMEDELYSSFISIIKEDNYYKNISEEDINSELDEIKIKVSETKETLDITKESIGSLISSGLDEDYTSYIEEAEKSYYNFKNKELILKIYKFVISFEDDFKLIYSKREKINEIIDEKKNLKNSLSIEIEEELLPLEKILLIQMKTMDNEREILENIANYTSRIKFKEERLEELKEANSSSEILVILREYGLVDTYDVEDMDIPEEILEEENNESIVQEKELPEIEKPSVSVEVEYDPYRIIEVKDYPKTLNIGLAKLKGESVREKVNKKLKPKETSEVASNIIGNIPNSHLSYDNNSSNMINNKPSVNLINNSIDIEKTNIQTKIEGNNEANNLSTFEESKIEIPVWNIPTEETITNSIEKENQTSINNDLLAWNIKPSLEVTKPNIEEEINNINIISAPSNNVEETSNLNNNMFWIPVSETKLETKAFPNINIPINNKGNENIDFPTMNS